MGKKAVRSDSKAFLRAASELNDKLRQESESVQADLSRNREFLLVGAGGSISPRMFSQAKPNVACDSRPSKKAKKAVAVSDDFRSLIFHGKVYVLTQNQGKMLRVFCESYLKGYPDVSDVSKDRLLDAIESETSQVRDSWRGSPLWKTLIVSNKRGTHRLSSPPLDRSK